MTSPRQNTQPEDSATARTPLLALHGFTGCGADFQWLAAQTADLFDWHTLDFPGHGAHADAPPCAHTPAAVARSIDATLTAIIRTRQTVRGHQSMRAQPSAVSLANVTQTTSAAQATSNTQTKSSAAQVANTRNTAPLPLLLGYSMGGRMALRMLAQYGTAKISGLILIGASAGLSHADERRARRQNDHALAQRIEAEGIDAFMQHWNNVPLIASQSRSPYFDQLQHLRRTNSAVGLARSLRGIGTGAVAPVHTYLPQINVPCLLLNGAEDTKFGAIATELANALPAARHVRIPDSGHSPHWENPQLTEATLRTWMATRNLPPPH